MSRSQRSKAGCGIWDTSSRCSIAHKHCRMALMADLGPVWEGLSDFAAAKQRFADVI
jgi:hypothetical protein